MAMMSTHSVRVLSCDEPTEVASPVAPIYDYVDCYVRSLEYQQPPARRAVPPTRRLVDVVPRRRAYVAVVLCVIVCALAVIMRS
jgi:hypothetical protein